MERQIKRDYYLEQLIKRKDNGLIKIVTGIRRCGKSYLLRTLFKKHLIESGVDEEHIIEMAFDLFDNIEYRDPKVFYPWAKEQFKDEEKYYFNDPYDNNGVVGYPRTLVEKRHAAQRSMALGVLKR